MSEYNAYKYNEAQSLVRGTRWATDEEIMRATRRIRLSDPDGEIRSGIPVISNGDTVYVDDSDAHSLIIGSTGSKKTRLFAMPMLEIMRRAGDSVVVTDPKGELYDLTAEAFEESGYRIYVINLRDPRKSNGWNPLALARDYQNQGDLEKASMLINDFSATIIPENTGKTDPFWMQTSRAMLQGLAMMIVEGAFFPDETVNLATLRHLSDHLQQDDSFFGSSSDEETTLELLKQYPDDSLAALNLRVAIHGSERTFENVKVSYEASVQHLYMQKSLLAMLSRREVDFTHLGNEKTILYLIMPDEKTTLHSIISLIVKQCYEQLISLAQICCGNTLPQRVNFLLDEFSNLPKIPDMPAMISAARSRNIRFFLIIQGLYQLNSKYGEADAQTIKGNCGNWVFLTSRELPLLNEISELCGKDAMSGEMLISTSQLQRLNKDKGEALILLGRQYPYIAHLADISDYRLPERSPRPFPEIPSEEIPVRTLKEIWKTFPEEKRNTASRRRRVNHDDDFVDLDDLNLTFEPETDEAGDNDDNGENKQDAESGGSDAEDEDDGNNQ